MTITYPLSTPSAPAPMRSKITMKNVVAVAESPFNLTQQVYEHPGKQWKLEIVLPTMLRGASEPWLSFFAKLNGRKGTFLYGDPDAKAPQGIATGTPLVNGGSQTGIALVTDGWTHGVTGIMKAGDYFQLGTGAGSQLYKLLDDVNSDGSGNATLTNFWPPLRSSPADNAAIVVNSAKGPFRLDADFAWDANQVSAYSVVFQASEAI